MTSLAYNKIIDLLSRRDHSPKELELKLLSKGFSKEEILSAINSAVKNGYIKDLRTLSEQFSRSLDRKLKGINYINAVLKSKQLPSLNPDWQSEYDKAKKAIAKELARKIKSSPYSLEDKKKVFRFLSNRGFAQETINRIINEKL